jgi:presequence protease
MTLLHGFKLVRDEFVDEIQSSARLYIHEQSGAELLSVSNHDENKVFGITFRTPPWDSTGVAHILEHSVLCGSRKFPVKEPFVELLKGSLQTFLNAFTYPDKTCYPVASQNLQDFYNLIDIYMDATLYPLLDKHTFEQEAWHYEMNGPDENPIYKGVVFNEMKGVYASADALLAEHSQRLLFPDTTYGIDYGGDPRHIPELTWEQLVGFHRKYYHPSNARIYFYGDDDPNERLRIMNEYLKEYSRAEIDSDVKIQSNDKKLPAQVVMPYPAGPDGAEATIHLTINWRLDEITDPEETLGLYLLDSILTDTSASPLRKALIDSGLGDDLTGVGLETQIRQLFFSTGMKGVQPGDETNVLELIEKTLQNLAARGIDPKTIEATINTEEFHFREMNTGSYPRGLSVMIAALQTWLYGRDPLSSLRYLKPLTSIKKRITSGEKYFESLISKWLLNNPHRTVLILKPDPDLKNRLDREETAILAEQKKKWSPAQIEAIIQNTGLLKKRQSTPDSPEALKCVPSLSRRDLEKKNRTLPITVSQIQGIPYLFHGLSTQGISYLDIGFDLKSITADVLGLVPIWSRAILETGTAKEDFVSLSQRIGRLTGGIDPELFASSTMNRNGSTAWLFLRGKALDNRLADLLDIVHDVLSSAQLDNQERIHQLIAEDKAELESNIIPSGHRYVSQRLRAQFNESDWIQEQLSGISYLYTLRRLSTMVEQDWPTLLQQLRRLHQTLTSRNNLLVNLTAAESTHNQAEKVIDAFLGKRPVSDSAATPKLQFHPKEAAPEGLLIPAQVNYVGKSMNLYRHGEPINGHSLVVSRYLRNAWLWDQVRVQGGAYGAFTALDYRSGQFTMVSYRDPNISRTLEIYDRTTSYLKELNIDEDEINRAVIGAIGDMDSYLLPDTKGFVSMGRYLAGDSEENRQKIRDAILSTTLEHFHHFGRQIESFASAGKVVVMGSPESLAALPGSTLTQVL